MEKLHGSGNGFSYDGYTGDGVTSLSILFRVTALDGVGGSVGRSGPKSGSRRGVQGVLRGGDRSFSRKTPLHLSIEKKKGIRGPLMLHMGTTLGVMTYSPSLQGQTSIVRHQGPGSDRMTVYRNLGVSSSILTLK